MGKFRGDSVLVGKPQDWWVDSHFPPNFWPHFKVYRYQVSLCIHSWEIAVVLSNSSVLVTYYL